MRRLFDGQSHLGKNAYTTYVPDTGSFLHKHMLITHFTWYKHMFYTTYEPV